MKNSEISGIPAENEDAEMMVNIYPNPGEGLFTVEINGVCSDNIHIDVIDIKGVNIYSSEPIAINEKDMPVMLTQYLDLRKFASGIYQVRVGCGNKRDHRLIVIAKQ